MKKIYLFLLFFVCSFGYGQFSILPINVTMCENTNQNFGFNLTTCVQVDANPADFTISYFDNEANAIANINAITDPTSYYVYIGGHTFYVRVMNIQTNEIQYASFYVNVIDNPIANPAVLTFCDPTATPIYNLEDATTQILGNQQNATLTYFDNPFSGGTIIPSGPFTQTIFPIQVIGVEVNEGICTSPRTSITLSTIDCNPCPKPTAITTTSITPFGATIGWTSPTVTSNEIIVMLAGGPAPTATSVGGTYANSNQYSIYSLLPGYCYDVYVRSHCNSQSTSDWAGPISFCTLGCNNIGNCPDNLNLRAFLDSNSNGVKDSNEVIFTNGLYEYQINDVLNTYTGYSNTGSFGIFDNNPANFYDLNFAVNQGLEPYFSSTTTYNNINILTGSGSQILYFPVTSLQPFQDLEVKLIPNGAPPRPGFTYTNFISYKNKGVETISAGTINFVKDGFSTIITISQSGTTNTANGFSYGFTNLGPNEERLIQIVMQVPTIPTVALGQILTNSVAITPVVGDNFPLNNTDDLSQTVVGSYDPNAKSEKHGGKIAMDEFTDSDYLTYTIQFENTGTASAQFVRIEDLLDAQLDLSSVMMLGSSHPVNMRKINNKLIWNFYDINLPPTISDPILSHGFVQFKVKPIPGFSVGTMIPNAADIYFDFNPAIATETCQTEFVATLSSSTFDLSSVVFYPNPASTFVHIVNGTNQDKIASISVYDVLGKAVLFRPNLSASDINLDVSKLTRGIYFVEIAFENQLKFTKKLIIQ
jgi:uncharacterized repeat protein (TIGR01451 family)